MTIDAPVPCHQLRLSCSGAGISPIKKCAFGLAPLNSDSGMPMTAFIVAERLQNRNCNKDSGDGPAGIRAAAYKRLRNRRGSGSFVHWLGRLVTAIGRG